MIILPFISYLSSFKVVTSSVIFGDYDGTILYLINGLN